MRRWWIALVPVLMVGLAGPAAAQTAVDKAAQALRGDPVYVDSGAEQAITAGAADDLRARIRNGGSPIFVAVLPASAAAVAGGDANQVAATLAKQVDLKGTYAVIVGKSFRAVSSALPTGTAGTLATTSFQAKSGDGVAAVLSDFVDRVDQATARGNSGSGNGANTVTGSTKGTGGGGVSTGTIVLLALLGLGGGGLFFWFRKRRLQRQKEEREAEEAERRQLDAELSVLSEDVIALESEVTLHPEARDDYDAGVARHQAAQAAMGHTGDKVDLVRVSRVIEEGRYAMSRARARIDGREPPPPPPQLTQPGRRNEPAISVDAQNVPTYVGYTGGFYGGGGWYGGGGGGLFTGLLLGQMMGGGWGYGGYGGGYYGDRDDDDRGDGDGDGDGDGGGDGGGGDFGGGDFGGGDFGGGDFGGGDFGGGDFGGGDFGGGDFGGGDFG